MKSFIKKKIADWGIPSSVAGMMKQMPILKQKVPHLPIRGLPSGLSTELFLDILDSSLGISPQRIRHQHISHWKISGAYRIIVHPKDGAAKTLIFKDADYNYDDIPALQDLNVTPGPSEYHIYNSSSGQLRHYLPAVYYCSELVEGKRYQYLLEDIKFPKGEPKDRITVAKELPLLHAALEASLRSTEASSHLIDYDRTFSQQLKTYAIEGIRGFAEQSDNQYALQICDNWPRLEKLYDQKLSINYNLKVPIHGDSNLSNILIAQNSPRAMKFIDWEWAGLGLPHWDLASLMKGKEVNPSLEEQALAIFSKESSFSNLTISDHRFLYNLCRLEQALLGAGFLSRQFLHDASDSNVNFESMIESALRRIVEASNRLTGSNVLETKSA